MSEIEKCPTCGTPVRVVSKPYLVDGPRPIGDTSPDAGTFAYTNHYEPLGLDALERETLEAVAKQQASFRQYLLTGTNRDRWAWEKARDEAGGKVDALIAARTAHVGKEVGE